ncbi:MAG: SMC-Scp complex subunit ScpB [Pseudomonadales bacterium]
MKIEDLDLLKRILEGALMASDRPLPKRALKELFDELECPDDQLIDAALAELESDCESRGFELQSVASGYRYQVREELGQWVNKLWKERAPRYSRALLETLSLVAYRQPITRGEIEEIRGVAVSTQIIKTLLEREWVKVVGHRDVPGHPAIYATTKQFLDYFNLKSLDQLPPLAEIRELSTISREFNIELPPALIESANDVEVAAEAESGEPVADAGEAAGSTSTASGEDDSDYADTAEEAAEKAKEPLAAFESWQHEEAVGDTVEDPDYEAELEAQMSARPDDPGLQV